MTEPQTQTFIAADMLGPFRSRRLVVVCLILVLAWALGHLGTLTRSLMVDAYVQVSAFVAATLLLFYGAKRVFRFDIGSASKNTHGFQVPMAALLGNPRLWWRCDCCGRLFFQKCWIWRGGGDTDGHNGPRGLPFDSNPT